MTDHKRSLNANRWAVLPVVLFCLWLTPAVVSAQVPERLTPGRMYFSLQVASSKQPKLAQKAVDRLIKQKYPAFYSGPDQKSWYRICVGPFETKDEALSWQKTMKSRKFKGKPFLVRSDPQFIVAYPVPATVKPLAAPRPPAIQARKAPPQEVSAESPIQIQKEALPEVKPESALTARPDQDTAQKAATVAEPEPALPAIEQVELMPQHLQAPETLLDTKAPAQRRKAPIVVKREQMPVSAAPSIDTEISRQEISPENKIYVHVFIDDYSNQTAEHPENTKNRTAEVFTLMKTVEQALTANLGLKKAKEEIDVALSQKKAQKTHFLPTLSTTYQMVHNYEERKIPFLGANVSENEYTFSATLEQPLFTGFALRYQYDIAKLYHEITQKKARILRLQVRYEANQKFFSLLKAQKLFAISNETVTQLAAHKEVARRFHAVGMIPLNDLLKSEVELANARQNFLVARNNLEIAKSDFNTFLRRPIHASLELKDFLDYSSFEKNIDFCLRQAGENRLEIKVNELELDIAEKELKIEQKDYYPSVSLQGNYYQMGTDWDLQGNEGISDPNSWNVRAVASWNLWEWGRTYHSVKARMSRLAQIRKQRNEILDNVRFEVKQAYLKMKEAEKNIGTIKKAIQQAKENFRINQARYKEQVATSTDVLDAQTLLSKTMTNYFTALYDFKIASASLHKAMGQEIME